MFPPRSIRDINNRNVLGYGESLDASHPGYGDVKYVKRRQHISHIAKQHRIGDRPPIIEYTAEENATWKRVNEKLKRLHRTHACSEYLDARSKINFDETEIPQLADMDDVLFDTSGWHIVPVSGLLHPRDFLNALAYKHFHSTQYVRHPSQPFYTPEPDVIHELIGHVPLLTNDDYSELIVEIGRKSLNATDKEIWKLTKIYWYTIEFGVVLERGVNKRAFGAGILSSVGELYNMMDNTVEYELFNPYNRLPKIAYNLGYQEKYQVLPNFYVGATMLSNLDVSKIP